MSTRQLATLKAIALALMAPGLTGLIVSGMISVHYLETMPRLPSAQEMRFIPRNIHGTVVYQTEAEDRSLNLIEYSSAGVFLAGLGLGLTYLEKWGARQVRGGAQEDELAENCG